LLVDDVIPCCCCIKFCRKVKIHIDDHKLGEEDNFDIEELVDLDQIDRRDLYDAQEMNQRLDNAIAECGGKPYVGDDIMASKKKEIIKSMVDGPCFTMSLKDLTG